MQLQQHALLRAAARGGRFLFGVGVHQEGHRRAVNACRRLYHIRRKSPVVRLVEVCEALPAALRVRLQVEVRAIGDALYLAPAPRKQVLDVVGRLGVVREFVGFMRPHPQPVLAHAQFCVPREAVLNPPLVNLLVRPRLHEVLDFHHLELARAEDEAARRNLVAERLADLRDAEGQPLARRVQHILEVHEYALRRLGPQKRDRCVVFNGPYECLEHQVEVARLGQLAAAIRALALFELVFAPAPATNTAVNERVGEAIDMPAGAPHLRVH